MAVILVTDGIASRAADALSAAGHTLIQQHYEPEALNDAVKEADVLVVRSATKVRKPVIDSALLTNRLKLIIRAGVGTDNIDVAYAEQNGITVKNTPAASTRATAELTIAHMIAIARHIHIANVTMRSGKWEKKNYKGVELNGKTLGLIGFGRIGKEVAKIASAIGMQVIYHTRSGKKPGFDQFEYVTTDELLRRADFISLHIPFVKENGPTISKVEFDKMKDGVYLINCARGGVVDESALLDALDSGKVAAAALDVYEQEPPQNDAIIANDKISMTPHIGALTVEAQARIGDEIVSLLNGYQ